RDLRSKSRERVSIAGVQRGTARDASGRQQSGSEHVVERQEHRRCDLRETPALIRTELERLLDAQAQSSNLELVADRETQASEQARLGPRLAAGRRTGRGMHRA